MGKSARTPLSRRRRWLTWLAICVALAGSLYLLATRSFVTRWVVLHQLGSLLGGEASAATVHLSSDGTLILTDAELRAPNIPGEGGVIFRVKRLEADIDLGSVFSGNVVIRGVSLDEPLARLSQSTTDRTLNVAALARGSGPADRIGHIPRVIVRSGAIELGEHSPTGDRLSRAPSYVVLRRIPVAGEVERTTDTRSMHVSFRELGPDGQPLAGPGGLQLEGDVTSERISLYLGVLSVSNWPAESLPSTLRGPYRQLELDGQVYGAELTYDIKGGVTVTAQLAGVAVTLPVEAQPPEDRDGRPLPIDPADRGKRLRMQRVQGPVTLTESGLRASLDGVVEELPYHVELEYKGASADSAFVCTVACRNFELRQRPEVLKFAPGVARRRLEQFSDPTGTLDVEVRIERGEPVANVPAPVAVTGTLRFRNTTAAFERFPYRFYNLKGDVAFSSDQIRLIRIEGDAPGGATIVATGTIAPPTDEAGVLIDVTVKNLPIDRTLAQAMKERARIVDALFSAQRYDELVEAGLIVPPERANEATPDRPVFRLGGLANVHTVVRREPGPDAVWHDRVEIHLPEAGMLAERVPYPLIARDVSIVKDDSAATVRGGTYTGVLGGSVLLAADADIDKLLDPALPFVPTIELSAKDVPIDGRLVAGLPRTEALERAGVRQRLAALFPGGKASAQVRLGMKGDEVDYHVDATLAALRLSPRDVAGQARVVLRDGEGAVTVDPAGVDVAIQGDLAHAEGGGPGSTTNLRARVETVEAGGWSLTTQAPRLDVSLPVEDFVRVFSPETGEALDRVRAEHQPGGTIGAALQAQRAGDNPVTLALDVTSARDVRFSMGQSSLAATLDKGTVHLRQGPDGRSVVAFEQARLALGTDPQTRVFADATGSIGLDGKPAGTPLELVLRDAAFESPILRDVLGSTRLGAFVSDSNLRGMFDLDLRVTPGADNEWAFAGTLKPKSFSLNISGSQIDLARCEGEVSFDPAGGRFQQLSLTGTGWTAVVDGSFIRMPDGGTAAQGTVDLQAASLVPGLLAAMPPPLREAAADLKMGVSGPIASRGAAFSLTIGTDGTLEAFRANGQATARGLTLEPGVAMTDGAGSVDFSVRRGSHADRTTWDLACMLDSVRAGGVSLSAARADVKGLATGEVVVPQFSAECHGGRVSGRVHVGPGTAKGREYQIETQAAGVRFASLLADWAPEKPSKDGDAGNADAIRPDESRGLLDAHLSLSGNTGDVTARRGRGGGTIAGGRVVNLPLVVSLVRVSNLELPIDERLDFGTAEFFVQGEYINFEELSLFSRSVQIAGFGAVRWPGMELDMRFRPKARHRIPVVTGVLEGIRNELVAAEVQGTIRSPEVKMTALSGTTRFLGRVFGASASDQQRRLDMLEKRAQENPRARPVDRDPVSGGQ